MNALHRDHDQMFEDERDVNRILLVLDDYEFDENDPCPKCGGDGFIALSECPELWGEDCFAERDRLVTCPECHGGGIWL
ncbi:hypothetical protein KQI63_05905 [bacterium]|nr:hypothetical protein [bacterium]